MLCGALATGWHCKIFQNLWIGNVVMFMNVVMIGTLPSVCLTSWVHVLLSKWALQCEQSQTLLWMKTIKMLYFRNIFIFLWYNKLQICGKVISNYNCKDMSFISLEKWFKSSDSAPFLMRLKCVFTFNVVQKYFSEYLDQFFHWNKNRLEKLWGPDERV